MNYRGRKSRSKAEAIKQYQREELAKIQSRNARVKDENQPKYNHHI
ncbi:hypothetical protein HMPREF9969_0796 [Prevotella sp. oral taxon 306 str. F0472]|nr:hypothetical protein HMPREF9969_0796 [Prevotella sp. oral taxon 306 str. F0472]